jgi:hypothetical protein
MKKLLRNKKFRSYFFTGTVLATILITSVWSQYNFQSINKINLLKDGLPICFGRVNQTYTAYAISEKASPYLQQNFMTTSEECFGEIIKEFKDNKMKIDDKKINQIKYILKSDEFRKALNWEMKKTKIIYFDDENEELRFDIKRNIFAISFLFSFFTESAGNIYGEMLLNPNVKKSDILKKWHMITEKNIRKHLKTQRNLSLVLNTLKISPSELIKLAPVAKLYAKLDTKLLIDIMALNPIVKRNIMYMAIGSSNPKF